MRCFITIALDIRKVQGSKEGLELNWMAHHSLNIFHQNIRGQRNKSDKLIHSFEVDGINPHILCLSKVKQDLLHLTLDGYLLGSRFCRQNLQRGGVCIFVKKDQYFNKTDISHHCKEQDLEICAIQLKTKTSNLIILSLYRDW
jgi:hypothetical protein